MMIGLASAHRAVRMAVLVLLMAPSLAMAQSAIPTREGNVWNWRAHEPVPSAVHRLEVGAGIAPSAAEREKAGAEVNGLYAQLLAGAGAAPHAMRQAGIGGRSGITSRSG